MSQDIQPAPGEDQRTARPSGADHVAFPDSPGLQELFAGLYDELHRTAKRLMSGKDRGHTLQTTALINEVYLRLQSGPEARYNDRKHFLVAAARAMRHVLIDHHRRSRSGERPQGRVDLELDDLVKPYAERAIDLEELNELLVELAEADPIGAEIIELRFFGGVSMTEIATIVDLPERSLSRRWTALRAWLHSRLA